MGWGVALLLALVVGLGVWHICSQPRRVFFKAKRNLPAHIAVGENDIEEVSGVTLVPGAVRRKDELLQRLTTAPLQRGAVISELQLYKPSQPLTGWLLFAVPTSATTQPVPGDEMLLMGIKKDAANKVCDKAIALGVIGEKVVIALPPEGADAVKEYLMSDNRLLAVRRLSN
jgi:hypothetical protein